MIYLDHLTTTPPLPAVVDAMQHWLQTQFGAPTAIHQHGFEARDAIDKARTRFAKLVNAVSRRRLFSLLAARRRLTMRSRAPP